MPPCIGTVRDPAAAAEAMPLAPVHHRARVGEHAGFFGGSSPAIMPQIVKLGCAFERGRRLPDELDRKARRVRGTRRAGSVRSDRCRANVRASVTKCALNVSVDAATRLRACHTGTISVGGIVQRRAQARFVLAPVCGAIRDKAGEDIGMRARRGHAPQFIELRASDALTSRKSRALIGARALQLAYGAGAVAAARRGRAGSGCRSAGSARRDSPALRLSSCSRNHACSKVMPSRSRELTMSFEGVAEQSAVFQRFALWRHRSSSRSRPNAANTLARTRTRIARACCG